MIQRFTNLLIGNNRVAEKIFPLKKNDYTKQQVRDLVIQQQQKHKNKNITMMVSVNVPNVGWRSAKQFTMSDNPQLVDQYEWEKTTQFVIYFWKTPNKSGGYSEHNDCVFLMIVKAIGFDQIPFDWRSGEKFKNQLSLGRDDMVPIGCFPVIEQAMKLNMNCIGDAEYVSSHLFSRSITLKLYLEHYTLVNTKSKVLLNGIPCKSQTLVLFMENNGNFDLYNGNEFWRVSHKEFYQLKGKIYGENAYIQSLTDDIETEWKDTIEKTNQLCEASNGVIDLKRVGYNTKNQAKLMLWNYTRSMPETQEITKEEEIWFRNGFMGGLIYGEETELQDAYVYDITSAYPNAMSLATLSFPMEQGTFTKLEKMPEILGYGMYRVIIEMSDDKHINKLFRFNAYNLYSHFDLKMAKVLGLRFTLIIDDEANALLYSSGRQTGSRMFKNLVKYLFKLKQQKVPFVKDIINNLWGVLCSKNKLKRIAYADGKIINVEDSFILSISPIGGATMVRYCKNNKPFYLYNYARIGLFLTSFCRFKLAETLYPIREQVYRFHTDGFITDKEQNFKLGTNLGDWKLEKRGHCRINNSMDVEWFN
jgi:hypothetical protein